MTLPLPAGGDYARIKQQLIDAVTAALTDSREEILRQAQEIQRTTATELPADSQPKVQLSYSGTDVEAHIRYPGAPEECGRNRRTSLPGAFERGGGFCADFGRLADDGRVPCQQKPRLPSSKLRLRRECYPCALAPGRRYRQ